MTMSKEVGKLEEEALKRKERLKNLKRKFDGLKDDEKPENEEKEAKAEVIPKPVFRNYKKDDDDKISNLELPNLEEKVKDQLEEMKEPLEVKDIDIANLAPRKPDFDLKRAIAKKLTKLERRTQKAISELIRERLNKDELLEQVNVGAQENQKQQNDSDSD